MTMVDWLLTEQLVEIFQEAVAKRPFLNAELVARDPLGEEGVLAGAGTAVRIEARDGSAFLVTPKRVARVVSDQAHDLVAFPDLVGYDWISPEMSEKVALKDEHFDRLYLYPRASTPIMLDKLGEAVYPLMTFIGRVVEYRSQKVLLRKLDDDVVELLGRLLLTASRGPFFDDEALVDREFKAADSDGSRGVDYDEFRRYHERLTALYERTNQDREAADALAEVEAAEKAAEEAAAKTRAVAEAAKAVGAARDPAA